MVDIFLDLPDEVIASYEDRARVLGTTAEDMMRDAIHKYAATLPKADIDLRHGLANEPIVKAAEIELESQKLGYRLGWRFITCPQDWAKTAKLLLISLNPAGREVHGPAWSQEEGSAYRVESWGGRSPGTAPLQRQVQNMFSFLGLADEQVFSAHWVPFRSPSWQELDHKQAAERYADQLWRWLLPTVSFERVVCIGKDRPGQPIARLLGARREASLPVGWGDITADRYRLPDGRPLVALPHLSRFALFGRPAGESALQELFDG